MFGLRIEFVLLHLCVVSGISLSGDDGVADGGEEAGPGDIVERLLGQGPLVLGPVEAAALSTALAHLQDIHQDNPTLGIFGRNKEPEE